MTSRAERPLTSMATATAAGLYVTLWADEPKNEPSMRGTIQLQQEGEQEATSSNLAKITLQQATTTATNAQLGTVAKV